MTFNSFVPINYQNISLDITNIKIYLEPEIQIKNLEQKTYILLLIYFSYPNLALAPLTFYIFKNPYDLFKT